MDKQPGNDDEEVKRTVEVCIFNSIPPSLLDISSDLKPVQYSVKEFHTGDHSEDRNREERT